MPEIVKLKMSEVSISEYNKVRRPVGTTPSGDVYIPSGFYYGEPEIMQSWSEKGLIGTRNGKPEVAKGPDLHDVLSMQVGIPVFRMDRVGAGTRVYSLALNQGGAK